MLNLPGSINNKSTLFNPQAVFNADKYIFHGGDPEQHVYSHAAGN